MFREKYRRDNDLLRAPEEIPEVIINMAKNPETAAKKSNVLRIAYVSAAACLLIAVIAALPFITGRGRGVDLPLTSTLVISPGDLDTAEDYSEIYRTITDLRQRNLNGYGQIGMMTDSVAADFAVAAGGVYNTTMAPMTDSTEETRKEAASEHFSYSADKGYSETNTQKEDVDEADVIKTDGRYIYRLTGSEVVVIDTQTMTVLSRIRPFGDHEQTFSEPLEEPAEYAETPDAGFISQTTAPASGESAVISPAFAPDSLRVDASAGEMMFANPQNLYISGDRLAVLYTKDVKAEGDGWKYVTSTGVMVYDITDRTSPVLLNDFSQSGHMADSRFVDGYIYLISNYYVYDEGAADRPETYVPCAWQGSEMKPMDAGCISILPDVVDCSYTVMSSVSILDGESHDSTRAAFGSSGTVYADSDGFILAFTSHDSETMETQENGENVSISTGSNSTTLVNFVISGGIIAQTTSGEVPGTLLNQFSIDRHNGITRVVTTQETWEQKIYTDGVDRYEYNGGLTNGLYTLDKNMNILGRLDGLAEEERVYSVRFSGDIGYFVTFRQVDPLFAVDLSDPASPTILSALKIPGFSQYMHPFADGLMLGLGMDADPETGATKGLKLSMFDISDPTDVTEKHKLKFDRIYWSEGLTNHRAVLVSADRDVIAFPVEGGYLVCGYSDEEGFYTRHELQFDQWGGGTRGLFIGDSFYICTAYTLHRFDIATFAETGSLEIADPDSRITGGYIIMD